MKQTFKFLTLSRVFNDCRDTVGRLSPLILLLFTLSFGFTQQAWGASSEYGAKKILYFDVSNSNTDRWAQTNADFKFNWKYKDSDESSENIGDTWSTIIADGSYYYTTSPDNAYCRTIQVMRMDRNNHSTQWNYSSRCKVSDRSSDKDNCIYIHSDNKDWADTWVPKWKTYVPPMKSLSIANNGTTTVSGSGSQSDPYIIAAGATIKVKATAALQVDDSNPTFKYKYKVDGGEGTYGDGNNTYEFTAGTEAHTYSVTVRAYATYNSTDNTAIDASNTIYFKIATYTGLTIADDGAPSMTTASSLSSTEVVQGQSVTITKGTPATGYVFSSYTPTNGSIDGDNFTPNANNASVTVNWVGRNTTVTLDDQGGSDGSGTVTATYGSAMPAASKPSKTGYTFDGYFDAETGGTQYYNSTPASVRAWDKDVSEATLYAHWTAKQTTITLDCQGGTGGAGSVTATYGQKLPANITDFVAPEKDGFNFKGYYSATTDGTQYYNNAGARSYDGTWASEDATATFYAQWENAATYSLTVATSPTTAFTASSGSAENITLGTPYSISATLAAKGYTFTGWTADPAANAEFGNKDNLETTVTVKNGSVTVTANAEAIASNLTLNGNGGEPASQILVMHYNDASLPNTYEQPTRTGYDYSGYAISITPSSTKIILQSNSFTSSTVSGWVTGGQWTRIEDGTLHACWTAHYKTIDLNKHYNKGASTGYGEDGKAKITVGTKTAETYTAATRTGHILLGYSVDEEGTTMVMDKDGNFIADVDGYTDAEGNWIQDIKTIEKLYAQWQECMTTVTVTTEHTDWGKLKVGNTGKSWGETVEVSKLKESYQLTATANTGYKFIEWVLADGAVLSTGALTNASIKVKGDSAHATGTATAIFAEDLSSNWYLAGNNTSLFPSGWGADETNMMKRATGHSTENVYYFTIHVDDKDIKGTGDGKESTYQFKIRHYKAGDGGCDDYFGSDKDNNHFWVNQTSTMTLGKNHNDDNLYFIPTVAGDYEFKVDATNGANVQLTVTWPIYNCVYGEFDSWDKDTHKLEFAGGDEASTVVNITDISKSYQFLVLVNSNYFTNTASFTTPITRSTASEVAFAAKGGSDNNAKFTPDIAGDYTFTYNKSTNKLTITYPALPTASTTATEARIFNESELSFIESGDGTVANPYKIYTDEALTIDITALAAQTNLTAKYQFGEEAATTDVLTKTITNPSTEETSIVVKAFYESDGVTGTAWEKTIYYQGVATPSIALSTTPNEYDILTAPDEVMISYRATNYSGSATITKDGDSWQTPSSASENYEDQLGQTLQTHTYVATATTNGRTFTSTLVVSVYKMVKVKVADENSLFTRFYMWRDGMDQTGPAWPGETFSYQVGTTHIFYVKYPTFDRFVLNNGKQNPTDDGAAQTVDVEIPAEDACYTIGEKITAEGDDKGKYACASSDCPNGLYVKDIDPVAALVGEGVLVSPQVDIEPGLDESSLTITFDYKTATGISCDQRGRSFMVTATQAAGETQTIEVTYSIEGADPVMKEVQINVTEAIMIQAKYGNLGWSDHNRIFIHYWGKGGVDGTINMTWKDYVGENPNKQDRVYARIPLDSDHEINFQIYAWDMNENYKVTNDVNGVTEAGCYIITAGEDKAKRNIAKDGAGLCWTAYYVEVDMNNGTVYRSNTVESSTETVSFFAPGASETGYKQGLVRIMENGTPKGEVASSTFTQSGVYTAKITTGGEGLSDVAPYTGDYYIRTDGASGRWDHYKEADKDNKFTKFDKIETSTYDHYWVKNLKVENEGDKQNLQACVANDYNENLANKIVSSSYTDGNGDVFPDQYGVNVRFGYDPSTNNFERAIIMGAASDAFLNVIGDNNNVYKESECQTLLNEQNENSKFADKEQWVYEKDVFVKIDYGHTSSVAKLQSQDFNGNVMYQLGFTIDPNTGKATTTPKTFGLIAVGTDEGIYKIHLVYDFKTNRMVSGWTPEGDIKGNIVLDADMLLVRKHQEAAQQIRFSNDGASISKIKHLYGVMEIEKSKMIAAETATMYELHLYWISFPFDVKVSSIFGVGTYGKEWKLQRYDGAERASKGWFKGDGTTTFWKDMTLDETMNANEGYILNLKPSAFDKEECEIWNHGRTVAAFYFPSVLDNVGLIKADSHEQSIPEHECKIDREFEVEDVGTVNHKNTDSHWNVMGIPAFQDAVPLTSAQGFHAVYKWVPSTNTYDVQEVNNEFPLQTMYAYMVQYHGIINWTNVSVISQAPYAYADGKNYTIELFFNGNGAEDHTYIKLADEAATDFELNEDMMKIDNAGFPNIYSFAGNYNVAYNETKMENQTVMLGVSAPKDGSYTFSMPKDFSGKAVLVDLESGEATDLNLSDYTVELNKGTYNNRFQLMLEVEAKTPTAVDNANGEWNADGKTKKLLINDQIYLINGGRVYNATGTMVK